MADTVVNPAPGTSPEVVFEGVGTPVAAANQPPPNPVNFDNKQKDVALGAAAAQFLGSGTDAVEVEAGGVGVPVADGNNAQNPQNFDNKGINVTTGAQATISDNSTSPKEATQGTAGIPVGDSNQPNFPVTGFDNVGKNVTVAPAAGPPAGNAIEVTFTGRTINVG
jgi:hypothetical protein